jgi:transcriptional regulator with XRE-family HTH domain
MKPMPKYKLIAKQQKLQLILEKEGGKLWGRVSIDGNLVFDSAASLEALEKKLKKALKDFEGIEDVQFEYAYDLTVFFEEYSFLNQSKIAELAGINPSLIRQYSSGHKQPSKEQLGKIEKAIRTLAEKLRSVQLSTKAFAQ